MAISMTALRTIILNLIEVQHGQVHFLETAKSLCRTLTPKLFLWRSTWMDKRFTILQWHYDIQKFSFLHFSAELTKSQQCHNILIFSHMEAILFSYTCDCFHFQRFVSGLNQILNMVFFFFSVVINRNETRYLVHMWIAALVLHVNCWLRHLPNWTVWLEVWMLHKLCSCRINR